MPQPSVNDNLQDFEKLGKPRLFFGATGGCMDPMVSNYTASKKSRDKDAYTPNGDKGFRPDYATSVYSRILKEKFPDVPVLIGGIEASLRRVTHYDYWSDKLLPTILETSKADMLVYGMGEQPLREIVELLHAHSLNSHFTFGIAVSSTIVPSICCPLAGVIVPAVVGLTDVVSVYLITGATSSVSDEQDTTNKTDNKRSIFFIAAN